MIININGEIKTPEEANISVLDRGFLYGDSVYEVTRTYEGIPFLLDEHYDRLWNSADGIHMPIQYSREELTEEISKTLINLGKSEAYVRIIITRGEGPITLDPTTAQKNNLIIITKEQVENPSWWYTQGVHLIFADTLRNPKKSIDPRIKSGNYLNNVMAFTEATKKGAYDALMLNHKGHVTEATTSNIWMVKERKLITPPLQAGILEGLTRKTVLQIARENNYQAEEKDITKDDLISADEAFITSTVREIVPVTKIDDTTIGDGSPGGVTETLHTLFKSFVLNYVKEKAN